MSLYAIGDFHLSFTVNKPMDVFDKRWKNHVVKIEKYWKRKVTENDTVVITGDHSWGRDLAECQADLDFIMHWWEPRATVMKEKTVMSIS